MVIRDKTPVQLILVERELTFRVQLSLVNETQLGKEMQTSEAASRQQLPFSGCWTLYARFCKYTLSVPRTKLLCYLLALICPHMCFIPDSYWACCSVHPRIHLDELLHAFLHWMDCEFQILREESGWSATHSKCLIPWDQEWEDMIRCLFLSSLMIWGEWWQFSGKGS